MINNYLSPLEFQIAIKRLPNVDFYAQEVIIPSISSEGIQVGNPLNYVHVPSHKLDFEPLEITFIIDEFMKNYKEMYSWITGLTFPINFTEYKDILSTPEGAESDISVTILDSNKNPGITFNFINCFPVSLSRIELNTTAADIRYPTATSTFHYDYYTIS